VGGSGILPENAEVKKKMVAVNRFEVLES